MSKKPRVLLGMSGGVDSSVSAVLLLEQGYEVIGGFMKNWSDGDERRTSDVGFETECSWRTERRDAMRVASQLGIEFHTFDFENEYRQKVYEYMIAEYQAGRTPNPDVLCNKYMKFDLFMQEADKLDCEFVATGHYARVVRSSDVARRTSGETEPADSTHDARRTTRPVDPTNDERRTTHLLAGVDRNKDQSYFLCQLTQPQLQRVLFPIGELEKSQVRDIAHKHNLIVADKKDSQGICFVGKVEMKDFLAARIQPHAGNIVTTAGKVIGQHQGFEFYTIGQRGGLGVGGGTPYYVVERKPETNEVIVAEGDEDPALYRSELVATELTETIDGNFAKYAGQKITARIRYRQPLAACTIATPPFPPSIVGGTPKAGGLLHVVFDTPQRAVAPGQFIAFYVSDELIGSGIIT